jgi:hypothetical protein
MHAAHSFTVNVATAASLREWLFETAVGNHDDSTIAEPLAELAAAIDGELREQAESVELSASARTVPPTDRPTSVAADASGDAHAAGAMESPPAWDDIDDEITIGPAGIYGALPDSAWQREPAQSSPDQGSPTARRHFDGAKGPVPRSGITPPSSVSSVARVVMKRPRYRSVRSSTSVRPAGRSLAFAPSGSQRHAGSANRRGEVCSWCTTQSGCVTVRLCHVGPTLSWPDRPRPIWPVAFGTRVGLGIRHRRDASVLVRTPSMQASSNSSGPRSTLATGGSQRVTSDAWAAVAGPLGAGHHQNCILVDHNHSVLVDVEMFDGGRLASAR